MATADLPATQLTTSFGAVLVGGPECCATEDTATYAELNAGQVRINNGGEPGFGYIEGITVTSAKLVAYCKRIGGGAHDPALISPGFEETTSTYPTINWNYGGSPWSGGFNMDPLPTDWGWVEQAIPSSQWFRFQSATLPGGQMHLSPMFKRGPADVSFYHSGSEGNVQIAYLAARVEYADPEPPPATDTWKAGMI